MSKAHIKALALQIKSVGEEVNRNLGCGFNETIYQNALAIEFRKKKIDYLKEVNIEIFYKGESVGVDRPDFIVTRIEGRRDPILLELKVADKITDNHRSQLKSYCTSLPKNNNPMLAGFAGGVLMAFPACDVDSCSGVKLFVVDPRFGVLIDDQADEDARHELDKSKQKKRKGN